MSVRRLIRPRALAALAALAIVPALAACGSDDDGASVTVALPDAPMSEQAPERAAAIEAAARATVDDSDGQIPAVWVGVWDEDGAHEFAYGDAAPGREATTDDVWRIGSITKTFTATVVLQLVEEGELALDDTVADVDPDLATRFPAYADITIRQLLAMRSGVADYLNVPDGIVADLTADPQRVFTADELIAGGVAAGVVPPGTAGYSTTNYIVLQEIVERLTGSTLPDQVRDRLTEPLGLPTTILPPPDDSTLSDPATAGTISEACAAELRADGGTATAGEDSSDWSMSAAQGGGAMQSTLRELGVWAASTSGGALLEAETERRREAALRPLQRGIDYGLGLMRVGDLIGHTGEAWGWEAVALHDPERDRTVVVATNTCAVGLETFSLVNEIYPDARVLTSLLGG